MNILNEVLAWCVAANNSPHQHNPIHAPVLCPSMCLSILVSMRLMDCTTNEWSSLFSFLPLWISAASTTPTVPILEISIASIMLALATHATLLQTRLHPLPFLATVLCVTICHLVNQHCLLNHKSLPILDWCLRLGCTCNHAPNQAPCL